MKKHLNFILGILVGALLFGGTAAAAAGILAERSTHKVFLNGSPVEVEAYLINGNNYYKLRDIAALVDFGVSWSGESQAVLIDTMVGYTPEGTEPSQPQQKPVTPGPVEDFSQKANPAIFTGAYTRDIYNAIRQTVIDRELILAGNNEDGYNTGYSYAGVAPSESAQTVMMEVTAAMGTWPGYSPRYLSTGELCCAVKYPTAYADAEEYCRPFIESLAGKSDKEKVREIAFYVCDRLTYDAGSTATPRTALVSDTVKKGNCMSYAHNFMFLCNLADIPCIFTHSEDHQWNQVYVDDQWWHVDVTGNDAGDDVSIRSLQTVLCTESDMQGTTYMQTQPEVTAWAKELLVPGSTK